MKNYSRTGRSEDMVTREVAQERAVEYVTFSNGVSPGDPSSINSRKVLQVHELTGIGFLHLDFKVTDSARKGLYNRYEIGRFDKWYPANTLEVMLFDGSTIWTEDQNIYARCEANKRYIVDLNGFYRK
ncbi:hypothetical protein Javan290_0003 [Streptococcus phage Javan290]|uniref:hypothetical protein n=1 Tax=Streptococcus marmotae TaxID=1825069 RepID=UPI00083061E6|nr:hypothetical protein [Streptococcus marmotae]QBX16942.1 hypothetical protein Javan291_0066 [Streptococcus phage Javan291]QBX26057.1 hypothetical protein Javan290_0003 [Streptococcus phage Javan290]